ncbi:FAD-binding oxidoreductase [Actinomycetospora corticicola]|uniref:Glycolate oxidase n=1 Tax=Actinomycetospora corticicola TaxID=663602 RepID=A0A7Y9DWV1_9PSEU|nr:FAD-linked oxidase C-terminal domain-containing protein [Actinomycetospora corticicola]NYD36915.1 glycolate oxidase [Actinomycetospora corticicola]
MSDLGHRLVELLGAAHVLEGTDSPDDAHDESLAVAHGTPAFVVRPASTADVVGIVAACRESGTPIVARGSGTGLSGGANAPDGAVVVCFDRLTDVTIDDVDHVAVVGPGVTLAQLDTAAREHGLTYPVRPGEQSASLGGTVATNAGGMHAVRYGVTRAHVLGLEAVLVDGTVVRAGGRLAKVSSGYDVVQLLTGSEGTLALVTAVVVRLQPFLPVRRTVLAPFPDLPTTTAAVARVVGSGLAPALCEYLDDPTMEAICAAADLSLGIPDDVRAEADAYLVVELVGRRAERVDEDLAELGELLTALGAPDVYALPEGSARRLVEAREQTFWTIKARGADEIVDVVVPRSAMAEFIGRSREIGAAYGSRVLGCGHAGDGNVHFAVFQPDPDALESTLHEILAAGVALGGAVSGEHGVGRAKAAALAELGDPGALAVMRRVRAALDPDGLLNPGCGVTPT